LRVTMPEHLAAHPWLGEFYGTLKHCIPAIFVGKIGWFSGDPVDLDPLPKPERAARMVRMMGGKDRVLAEADRAVGEEDYLWAAEMLGYLVSLEPDNPSVRQARAEALRGWSFQQSNPNWRNWGLSCAMELDPPARDESAKKQLVMAPPAVVRAFPPANILRGMATRLKAEETGNKHITVAFAVPSKGLNHALELRRCICEFHEHAPSKVDLRLTLDADFFTDLVSQRTRWPDAIKEGRVQVEGDRALIPAFFGSFEPPMAPQDIQLVSR